jgi:Predicted acetyltransferase involved in intracellular survival and related acetyltransferases
MVKTLSSDYVVKPVDPADIDRAIEIWSLSFGFMDRPRWISFFNSILDTIIGAYHGDNLVTIVGVINLQMWFGGKLIPCAGISAVAADPAHRRRGLVRRCIVEALRHLHQKRVPITALWPFSYPFYEKMGWAASDLQYVIETQARVLPDVGNSSTYTRIHPSKYELLKPLHEKWIESVNLGIRRGDLQWSRLLNHPLRETCIFMHEEGYMLWNVKDPTDRTLEIVEWAWLTEDAFRDGLSLLRKMEDLHFDKVRWITCDPEPLLSFGITSPPPNITVKPALMSRVLHTDAFVELLGRDVPPFAVNDPLAISNHYKVDSIGRAAQSGKEGSNGSENGQLLLGPGELLQAATGFWSKKPAHIPDSLYNVTGDKRNFTVEFF